MRIKVYPVLKVMTITIAKMDKKGRRGDGEKGRWGEGEMGRRGDGRNAKLLIRLSTLLISGLKSKLIYTEYYCKKVFFY